MGVLHEFLDALGQVFREFCRRHFLAFAVVLGLVVEVFARRHAHFGGRERLFAFDVAAARFAAGDKLFAQQAVGILEQVLNDLAGLVHILRDADANGRAAQRVLDYQREPEFVGDGNERVARKVMLPDDAVRRGRNAVRLVDFLGFYLVHREGRCEETAAGVRDVPVFEHGLDVAVFAPFAVECQECDIGGGELGKSRGLLGAGGRAFEAAEVVDREVVLLVRGKFAGGPVPGAVLVDQNGMDVVAFRVHGAHHTGAADYGNIMFGGRTTHQDQNA